MELNALEDEWRDRLGAIWMRYQVDRDPEIKQEYLERLRQFADLIIRGNRPNL
jgi:hypothetical protein